MEVYGVREFYYIFLKGEQKNKLIGVQEGKDKRDAAINFFKSREDQNYFDEELLTLYGTPLKIKTMIELEEEENEV